ncbi:dihydrofolate reductase family protein [Spirillospora sp. CA-142024]|uniref:dihydrofolate reductase family protein n=1 Tax=Spirillospora sp. CA-142024 TaxID=3240036 RepID=UPI003D93DF19
MRKLTYYVGVTLDGFIAGPGDEFDFLPIEPDVTAAMNAEQPETVPGAFREAVGVAGTPNKRFDTVVMGRGTYEPALKVGITDPYPQLKTYVFSRTLPATDERVTVVAQDPAAHVRELKHQDGMDIWLCGGGRLAAVLRDEIDELVLKRYPLIIGSGRPLFDGPFHPDRFTQAQTRVFESGAVISRYVKAA